MTPNKYLELLHDMTPKKVFLMRSFESLFSFVLLGMFLICIFQQGYDKIPIPYDTWQYLITPDNTWQYLKILINTLTMPIQYLTMPKMPNNAWQFITCLTIPKNT